MVVAGQGVNALEIHAAGVESGAGCDGHHGHGLRHPIEGENRAGFAMWANGLDALAGMQVVHQGHNRGTMGKARRWNYRGWCSRINWGGRQGLEKIGGAYAWAQFIIIFMQRRHQQAWLVGLELEGKAPEPGTIEFLPSLEDTLAVGIEDGDICLGERNGATKISKWPQAYQGGGGRGASHGPAWLQEEEMGPKPGLC